MTDDERELAEWVAKWAGWKSDDFNRLGQPIYRSNGKRMTLDQFLTDNSLAFRAGEYVERNSDAVFCGVEDGVHFYGFYKHGLAWSDEGDPRIIRFRALRAVKDV